MSETVGSSAVPEVPVAFSTFADTLRPPKTRDGSGRVVGILRAGDPDEIWLKLLGQKHGNEKHSMAAWSALIEHYRKQPAHPTGMM